MLCHTSLFIFSLCRHVTFYKTLMSLSTVFIKGHVGLLQLLKSLCRTSFFTHVEPSVCISCISEKKFNFFLLIYMYANKTYLELSQMNSACLLHAHWSAPKYSNQYHWLKPLPRLMSFLRGSFSPEGGSHLKQIYIRFRCMQPCSYYLRHLVWDTLHISQRTKQQNGKLDSRLLCNTMGHPRWSKMPIITLQECIFELLLLKKASHNSVENYHIGNNLHLCWRLPIRSFS